MWQKSLNCAWKYDRLKGYSSIAFINKSQVTQITVYKHKSVSAKWYVENVLSKVI